MLAANPVFEPSCRQIVLNSVAIGFVFELDEFLYEPLVGASRRAAFEGGALLRATSPLSSIGSRRLVATYCWLIFLLDVGYNAFCALTARARREFDSAGECDTPPSEKMRRAFNPVRFGARAQTIFFWCSNRPKAYNRTFSTTSSPAITASAAFSCSRSR